MTTRLPAGLSTGASMTERDFSDFFYAAPDGLELHARV
jgi:hypothetical protein